MKCYETLLNRGYIYQSTDDKEIERLLNEEKVTFYLGIDPTADSLHIGHFFALSMARWLQDFGHKAIILIGGATALVGDPSGKSDMRGMLTKEEVKHNKEEVKKLVTRFVQEDTLIVDNYDWFQEKGYVDFMRDIGIHFNVNKMLATDAYKSRLENGGLTFLEMGYMLMQAYDFIWLNENHDCILQIGGSDQWANIVAGVDLGRKLNKSDSDKNKLLGLTCPLLIKADGEKMGKTATGTLWVSRNKTDVYDFYQNFMNVYDEDVERLLAFFTKLDIIKIKLACKEDIIKAKKLMAYAVTRLVHGEEEARKVKEASEKIFSGENTDNIPTEKIKNFKDMLLIDLLQEVNLTSSKSEGRRLISGNGIILNKERVTDINYIVTKKDFIENELIIQRGKKVFQKVKI